jgi:1-acyl-sn-glycerol-3-phosphate acyltransferase
MFVVYFFRFLARMIVLVIGSLHVTGRSNIPHSGPYIVVTNHMSKADPPIINLILPPIRVRFFAGEKWEKNIILGPLMGMAGAIYINRGEVDRRALRQGLEALKEGSVFGLAPEGTRSKVGTLIEARDGAAYLANRAGVPILPVGIANTDLISRRLPRLRRTRMEAQVGEPFMLPDLGRRVKGPELAAYTHLIMAHIAALLPERYWGVYAGSPAIPAILAGEDPWPHCLAAAGLAPAAGEGAAPASALVNGESESTGQHDAK